MKLEQSTILGASQSIGSWDLELELEAENYESYFKIMDDIKDKFSDIIKFYDSVLITSEAKQVFSK